MKKEDKKIKKQYWKNIKQHRKEMIAIAKSAGPWHYGWSVDFLLEHLKMIRDYYELGYNVWSEEDPDPDNNRLEVVSRLIFEYESYQELPLDEKQKIADELNIEVEKIEDNFEYIRTEDPLTITVKNKYYDDDIFRAWIKAREQHENVHLKKFMDLIQEKLKYLSD